MFFLETKLFSSDKEPLNVFIENASVKDSQLGFLKISAVNQN